MFNTMKKLAGIAAAVVTLAASVTAMAATYDVPVQFSTIQEAIDYSANGDVISVRPGIYYENLTIREKQITLQSTKGPAQTIIDGAQKGAVITIGVSSGSMSITGFTIQHGSNAGINISDESKLSSITLTVDNCVIINNSGVQGGGIKAYSVPNPGGWIELNLNNSSVVDNTATYGGGIYKLGYGGVVVTDSTIANNKADTGAGVFVTYLSNARIIRSNITGNAATTNGGGVVVQSAWATAEILGSVIDLNSAGVAGGGIYGGTTSSSSIIVRNATITRNSAPVGGSVKQDTGMGFSVMNSIFYGNSSLPSLADLGKVIIRYSDIEGGAVGEGNIDADPLFVNALARNYQLSAHSPAFDTGMWDTYSNLETDMLGVARPSGRINDMGAFETFVPVLDTTPPVSTATVSGTIGNGIYISDVFITITAQDASGVKEIHYTINGTETVVPGATATISLTADGVYGVSYFAVDNAGNAEVSPYSVAYPIDKTAPVSSATAAGTVGTNGTYTTSVTINITAQDNRSVKEIHYVVNGVETVVAGGAASIALTANGTYAISYFAVDTSGITEAAHATTVVIDKTAPAVTSISPANGATGVSTSSSVVLTFGENILQGSAFANITLKKGTSTVSSTKTISGNKLTIKPSSSLSSASTYTVTIPAGAVKDSAGNTNAASTYTFKTR